MVATHDRYRTTHLVWFSDNRVVPVNTPVFRASKDEEKLWLVRRALESGVLSMEMPYGGVLARVDGETEYRWFKHTQLVPDDDHTG